MPSVGSITYNFKPVTKTAVATTNIAYTANNGELVLVDATAAQFTVTLPTNPTAGMQVAVKKTDATANKVIVISGSAATIDGDSSGVLLGQNSAGTFVYDSSSTSWKVVGTSVFNTAVAQGVVPSAGSIGQALTKTSGTDYATGWSTINGVPSGGTSGQVLTSTGSSYNWAAASSGGGGGQFPSWASGSSGNRVYTTPYTGSTLTQAVVGYTATSYANFFPIQIPNACTINAIGVWNGNSAMSGWFYVAPYSDLPSGTSGGPFIRQYNYAPIYVAGNPYYTYMSNTIAWQFTSSQLIWLGFGTSANLTLVCTTSANTTTVLPVTPGQLSGYPLTQIPNVRFSSAYTSTGAPADMSTVGTTTTFTNLPVILFSIA